LDRAADDELGVSTHKRPAHVAIFLISEGEFG